MAKIFDPTLYDFDYKANQFYSTKSGGFIRRAALIKLEEWYRANGKELPYTEYGKPRKAAEKKTPRTPRANVSDKIKDHFRKDTPWKGTKGGHLQNWAKPLSISGGKDANYGWSRKEYYDSRSPGVTGKTSGKWGSDVGGHKGGAGGILNGTEEFIRHLQLAIHAVEINSANFRIAVGQRAMKVFQTSFQKQKFYSKGARAWRPLADYTEKKRAWRGTGNTILDEYGDLKRSIKLKENVGKFLTQIYTDVVPANESHHKKHSICYAGYHNEGRGQYGRARNGHKPHRYFTRRFMGHSSHLNPMQDGFMKFMMKRYLFDSVFLVKEGQLLSAK